MKITPLIQYQTDVTYRGFTSDTAQQQAIEKMEMLFNDLLAPSSVGLKLWYRLFPKKIPKSLYFHGKVGSGKTYLMDLFYHCLPAGLGMRQHFHPFMREVHQRLKTLQGKQEPLLQIAKELAQKNKVICFDELFVEDIGDATILGKLLGYFFSMGVILVVTSNAKPDELYKNGLQRQRFLPVIELIKQHCDVVAINSQTDYRLQQLADLPAAKLRKQHYFTPLDKVTAHHMQEAFTYYAHATPDEMQQLIVNGYEFTAIAIAAGVLWLDFNELCVKARHVTDYLYLAGKFHTLLISNIPILSAKDDHAVKRFIYLIDVLYDENIRVIISAESGIDQLYQGTACADKFKRTISRLHEMQAEAYPRN